MPDRPATLRDVLAAEAKANRIPLPLAEALVSAEGGFEPGATTYTPRTSPKGAIGIMQLMPDTAKELGVDPNDPVQNIQGGLRYLRQQLDAHGGNVERALAAYNAGPGAVAKAGGVPNIPETQAYVQRILGRLTSQQAPPPTAPPTAPTRPTTPPAPSRGLFRGLAETALPFASVGEAKEVAQAFVGQPLQALATMGKGLLSAQAQQFVEAKRAASEMIGAPPGSALQFAAGGEMLGRTAAGLLPIVGPVAAETGEAFGRGETAYGIGRAIGMVLPTAVSKGLRGVRASKLAPGEIPLTRGERTGSSTALFTEALVEKTFPGRKPFRELRARQQQALITAANQAVDRIGTGAQYPTGRAMRETIEQAEKLVTESIGGRYQLIDDVVQSQTKRIPKTELVPSAAGLVDEFGQPVSVPKRTMEKIEVGGVQPETTGLKKFAVPLLRRVRKEAELLPPNQLAPVIESLERIVQSPKRMGYQAFQDARTDLLAIARRHGDPIPGKAGGLAKKLAGLTDEAMEKAAVESGLTIGPRPLQEFVRETNKLWAEATDAFNETVLAKMVAEKPERVHLLLEQAGLDDIAAVKQYTTGPVLDRVKANLLRTWLSRDVQGESMVKGRVKLPEISQMRGRAFREAAEAYAADGRLQELFGAKGAQDLLEIAKTAEQLATRTKEATAGLIAGGISSKILAGTPIIGLFFGSPIAGTAFAGGAGAALNVLARLMTKPEGLTSIRRTLRAIGTGRVGEIESAVAQMQDILRRQEEASEVGTPPPRATGPGPRIAGGGPVGAPPPAP